jgi:hypothetical protein
MRRRAEHLKIREVFVQVGRIDEGLSGLFVDASQDIGVNTHSFKKDSSKTMSEKYRTSILRSLNGSVNHSDA